MSRFDTKWVDAAIDFSDQHALVEMIELILVYEREPRLSISELRDRFPSGAQPSDAQMSMAFAAIADRRNEIGALYPFNGVARVAMFDSSRPWELYAFLLLMSFRGTPTRQDNNWPRSDRLFDDLVHRVVASKMGTGGKALVFGWPPRGDRPSNFPKAVKWVAREMGLKLRTKRRKIPDHYRDAGVDVVGWAPFADGRTGFPICLVQCTVQMQYVGKPRDVRPATWRDWVKLGTTPSVGFAIPFHVPEGHPWWDEVAAEVSMFLHRPRLLGVLDSDEPKLWDSWADIVAFVADEFREMEAKGSIGATQVSPAGSRKRRKRT